ncbi:MAG: heavy-metal-associated domain-containing protein [Bacillaceae bacterium]|nr:heavy-metal-associated domain-containing protein [Bacillaceae bacterium]
MNKTLIFAAGFLIIALIALQINTSNISSTEEKQETVLFQGVDVSCDGCEDKLHQAMENIIGIQQYQLDPPAGELTVTYETDDMQAEWIKNSLEAAGFTIKDWDKVQPE